MKPSERHPARTGYGHLIITGFLLLGLLFFYMANISFPGLMRIVITVGVGECLLVTIYLLVDSVYFTEENVECYRFGKLHRSIPWSKISIACELSDFPISANTSQVSKIVLVPEGCPPYDSSVWIGIEYLFDLRNMIIWVHNTKRNREFLQEHNVEIVRH